MFSSCYVQTAGEVQQACSKRGDFYTGCISSFALHLQPFLREKTGMRRSNLQNAPTASPGDGTASCNCGKWKAWLLPWPLWCRVGVGVDGRRCRVVCWNRRVGVGRVRRRRVLGHEVRLTVGGHVGGRGGGGGQVEVEWGGRSGRGGGCRRSRDPLQDDVWVKLGLGAVESGQGGLQQTLLTPV